MIGRWSCLGFITTTFLIDIRYLPAGTFSLSLIGSEDFAATSLISPLIKINHETEVLAQEGFDKGHRSLGNTATF